MTRQIDRDSDFAGLSDSTSTGSLFGQTMGLVAVTMGLFALGSYLGRSLSYGWGWVFFIAAFVCLIGMRFAVRGSGSGATGLLFAFGVLMGLATGPTIVYYVSTGPAVVWEASGATALFMLGLGSAGYATNRDLSGIGRIAFFALFGLIVFGVIMIFTQIPNGSLIYSVLGLVIFAGLTMFDFQRLRLSNGPNTAPLLAASIFLDALNVFLFFLNIFDRRK